MPDFLDACVTRFMVAVDLAKKIQEVCGPGKSVRRSRSEARLPAALTFFAARLDTRATIMDKPSSPRRNYRDDRTKDEGRSDRRRDREPDRRNYDRRDRDAERGGRNGRDDFHRRNDRDRRDNDRRDSNRRDEGRGDRDRGDRLRRDDERDGRRRDERRRSASPSSRPRSGEPRPKSRSKSRSKSPENKAKPNFGASGLLAADTKTVQAADGSKTVLKYHEPPEARKPLIGWRLYVFKGSEQVGEWTWSRVCGRAG